MYVSNSYSVGTARHRRPTAEHAFIIIIIIIENAFLTDTI